MQRVTRGLVLPAFFVASSAAAQAGTGKWADSAIALINIGMSAGKAEGLDPAIALIDRVLTVSPSDGVLLHYKGYALYRKAILMLSDPGRKDETKATLDEAHDALEASGKTLNWPETPALRSSVLGQLIGVSGMISGMTLGPRAENLMDDALALGPKNPRVWMLKGVAAMFKPRLFGGGMDKAEVDLQKAIELFASDHPTSPQPMWGHAEAYAWLGQVYADQKRVEEARVAYRKALEVQPGFGWVTHVLLPALDKVKP